MSITRLVTRVLVFALAFVALASGGRDIVSGQAPTQPPELDVVLFAKNVMVPMRNGVHLATDIYRPALNGEPVQGRLPLLLQRTPYNKEGAQLVEQFRGGL